MAAVIRCGQFRPSLLNKILMVQFSSSPFLITKARKRLKTIPQITLLVMCEIALSSFANGAIVVQHG